MAGLQPNIWAGVAIPWLAALTSLVMRVCARRMTKMSWWFDDYFSILAFIFATGYCSIMVQCMLYTYNWSGLLLTFTQGRCTHISA